MMIREISAEETGKLRECMESLAAHHNRVSVNFQGCYPFAPITDNLRRFSRELTEGQCRIAVAEEDGKIIGFCKADNHDGLGKLDYLIVLEEYRGRGCGRELMDWAMRIFKDAHAARVEVKVVDGNEAIRFYEAYGFRVNSHFLTYMEGRQQADLPEKV